MVSFSRPRCPPSMISSLNPFPSVAPPPYLAVACHSNLPTTVHLSQHGQGTTRIPLKMSSSETPPPTPQEAQEALNVIADLLCPAHKHRITAPGIDLRKQARYSMVIDCPQEDGTIWQVGMSADFRVKVIGRCKVLSTSDCKFLCQQRPDTPLRNAGGALTNLKMNIALPGHANITTLVPLCAWEGLQCDDILWLLSIGHLKEGWWEDNPSRLSDQRKDHR